MAELQPWHQQPYETTTAYRAFVTYRDIEPSLRSLPRVASELGKGISLIKRWSSRWSWVKRAEAWDAEEDKRLRLSRIEAKRKMDEEHLRIACSGRNKAVQALAKVDPDDLNFSQLTQWLDLWMRWERLIIGEPGTIKELRTNIEQRRALAAAQDWDIEKEMEKLMPIVEELYREGGLEPLEELDDDSPVEDPDEEDA